MFKVARIAITRALSAANGGDALAGGKGSIRLFIAGTGLIRVLSLICLAFALLALPASAQELKPENIAPTETEMPDSDFASPVIVDGQELFVVRGNSALPARERAKDIQDRIIEIAEQSEEDSVKVEISNDPFGKKISVDGQTVITTTNADAENDRVDVDVLAALQAQAIEDAILQYRESRSSEARVNSSVAAAAWSAAFLLISLSFFTRRKRFVRWIEKLTHKQFRQVEEVTQSVLRRRAVAEILAYFVHVILWVIYLLLLYYYLSLVLLSFAETRPFAQLLLEYVSRPLVGILFGIIGYLPNLLMLVFIGFVTKYVIRGVKLYFDNLEQGVFQIQNFEKQWIGPTFLLLRILIILIALVFAYPYVPGSDSSAFQGLTILAGVMVSLGSNTVVSNMMAGLFVIYRRSTNVGDRIAVGDKVGDVYEIKLMETVIKSVKNEMISIPNATLLNSEVVNYSRKVDGRGLLVHTTVGIGYEEPPAKILAMLIEAASRTKDLKKNPPPFVLWKQLGDYAINYEINAYTTRGGSLPKILSDLHENIVEVFNENGTQIMTPSYIADPESPKIPDADWDQKLARIAADESK